MQSNEHLKKRVGDVSVKVEPRGLEGTFGTGKTKTSMKFAELIDKLEGGKGEDLYLTTQYEEAGDNGEVELPRFVREYCPAPLPGLLGDFPLRPALLANLVPQQVICTSLALTNLNNLNRLIFGWAAVNLGLLVAYTMISMITFMCCCVGKSVSHSLVQVSL